MARERDRSNDDEEHRKAFGEHVSISQGCRETVNRIKNNDPTFTQFNLYSSDAEHFSALAWELLGRYIADNDHLDDIDLSSLHLTDVNMTLLFKYLTRASSLKTLNLARNEFELDGIQSMVPFLENSRSLTKLVIGEGHNNNINNECFRLLINALHGGSIEQLRLGNCEIDDITALEQYTLPHLQILSLKNNSIHSIPSLEKYTNLELVWLGGNNIGKEGCRSIAKLLQKESSSLRYLYLTSNDIGDEEAEIIANSLKHNTTLKHLWLTENNFKEKGRRAFLKLLNDVSSIERTYNSNHTLTTLNLPYLKDPLTDPKSTEMEDHIASAIETNEEHPKSIELGKHIASAIKTNEENRENSEAGRAKVIATQLNRNTRMELCRLQGVGYSYSSIFAEIEPFLLPDLLALTGGEYGQSELYRMLIATVPDLASVISRKGVLKQKLAKNMELIAALTDENLQMNEELESIESGEGHKLSGKKRG